MKLKKEQIQEIVDKAFEEDKSITVITYYLSNYGEMILNTIGERLLELMGREDIGDILYTAVKELVMNAAKANLKRTLIEDYNLDPESEEGNKRLMELFKENIRETQIKKYRTVFKERGMAITIKLSYTKEQVLCVKVNNAFGLLPHEELRVREKFQQSMKYNDLMEYYLAHGDDTEGAGMGITLVEILLGQSGFDRHLFTIYTDKENDQTVARVELPLTDNYTPQRLRFKKEMEAKKSEAHELRGSGNYVAM